MHFCKKCGKSLLTKYVYCPNCGTKTEILIDRKELNIRLEITADNIEYLVRSSYLWINSESGRNEQERQELFAIAWNLKQIARRGTNSEGI